VKFASSQISRVLVSYNNLGPLVNNYVGTFYALTQFCFSLKAAKYCEDFVTSVIVGNDVISR
jgi:hypothetical protein